MNTKLSDRITDKCWIAKWDEKERSLGMKKAVNSSESRIENTESKVQNNDEWSRPNGNLKGKDKMITNTYFKIETVMRVLRGSYEQTTIWRLEYHDDFVNLKFCINMGYLIIKQNGRLWYSITEACVTNPGKSWARTKLLIP